MTDAGWHEDPTGRFEQRWFDGRRWTKRVRVGDAEAIDTSGVGNDLQPPVEREGPPPGWRPDPDEPGRERFFDGHDWSAATRDDARSDPPGRKRDRPIPRVLLVGLTVGAVALGVILLLVLR